MKKLLLFTLLAASGFGAVGCAYQQVMDERRSENAALQQQLGAEQSRTERLSR